MENPDLLLPKPNIISACLFITSNQRLEQLRSRRRIVVSWLLYTLLVTAHIPISILPHLFDKNIAPQFIILIFIAVLFAFFIGYQAKHFLAHKYLLYAATALIGAALISAFLSNNVISSLTGDTGRYAGVAALISLLIISGYHLNFSTSDFVTLLRLYLVLPIAQSIFGILQHYKLIDFPGATGFSATLGNEDFFAAYIGISAPLFILAAVKSTKKLRVTLILGYIICMYALYEAGPLQAYVDLAITILGLILYKFRSFIPKISLSLNIRNAIGTLLVIIWAQVIFLTPFLGSWIPILGNDLQVKIRGNFWLAATKQFIDHPMFGVGPDQYGNNYEQYRTLSDAKTYTQILSNDAHSASVQTLATLGLIGTVGFLLLLTILIRAILLIWDTQKLPRAQIFLLSLFFFVYLTNSFVSPITFPAKYLFWAVSGWVIGQVYLKPKTEVLTDSSVTNLSRPLEIRVFFTVFAVFVAYIGTNFAIAQWRYSNAYELYAKNSDAEIDYGFNPYLPCFMYFDGQFNMTKNQGLDRLRALSEAQIHENPRCVAAHLVLAQVAKAQNDVPTYKREVYRLVELAPARSQVLNLALEYANVYKDYKLLDQLKQTIKELNLLYVPGSAG